MNKLTYFVIIITLVYTKEPSTNEYILFVEVWPPSWTNNTNFTNNYFTIHGIWPQYYNGSYPQYCNNDTSLFNISYISNISRQLSKFWTDFIDPQLFWKNEFYKHGTCCDFNTSTLDKNIVAMYTFFDTGLKLREIFNTYNVLYNKGIKPSNTKQYDVYTISDTIKDYIKYDVILTCTNGILSEIIYCLDNYLGLIDCPYNIEGRCDDTSKVLYKKN